MGSDPLAEAERLEREMETMLAWYEDRRLKASRWMFWRPKTLDPAEGRLQRFLAETVQPCTLLLIGALFLYEDDPASSERRTETVRARAAADALSYRALYNLALFEVLIASFRAEAGEFEVGLQVLRLSLNRASGRSRQELVKWARVDPTLAPVRTDSFYGPVRSGLLDRYDTTAYEEENPPPREPPLVASG